MGGRWTEGEFVICVPWDTYSINGGMRMVKRIVVLEKGVEKKDLAANACCAVAPTGRMAK